MAIFKRESIDVGRVELAKPIGVNLRKYFVYFDKKSVAKWRHLLHNVENDFN